MIKSMTGFGRYEMTSEDRKITAEIKAVNHKYLDISIKIPKKLNFLENSIRNIVKQYANRGKMDVTITLEDVSEHKRQLKYNRSLAEEYVNYIHKMKGQFRLEGDINVIELSRYPDVITMEEQEVEEQAILPLLTTVLSQAGDRFTDSRIKEGENLKTDLMTKLEGMAANVELIEKQTPQIISEYRDKLKAKVEELLGDAKMDENRLLTEVTIFADKVCTDEEIVRLKSHIINTGDALERESNIGRKLDFFAQEMNREANTILSKSNNLTISNLAIDLKLDIEKIREQIQNIE
jgi:uncharacterized protein (TIGR00255 family)